jgi:hypothetical protein
MSESADEPLVMPAGLGVEIEFISESKPNQRGLTPGPVDYDARGFELIELHVPENLGFGEPFRVEWRRKWVNLTTVAELRYLPEGSLAQEVERLRQRHESVRQRLAERPGRQP